MACSALTATPASGLTMSAEATPAAGIKVISANGLRAVLADIAPAFERASGHRLAVTITETGEIRERILSGARYDVIALPQTTVDALARLGPIDPNSIVPVIRVSFGLAVRTVVPKPDVSSADGLKRALLAAQSVLITDPATGGISGVHFMNVLERLGIVEELKPKLVLSRGGGHHDAGARACDTAHGGAVAALPATGSPARSGHRPPQQARLQPYLLRRRRPGCRGRQAQGGRRRTAQPGHGLP